MRPSRVLFALFSVALALAGRTAETRPNFVVILVDDLGIRDLGCYGRAEHHTPHLDRLAAEGVRFTSATCAQPICSPSRAALLTGKCPARLHLTNYLPGRPDAASQKLLQPVMEGQLPRHEVTLAELLKTVGYTTACIGKWHLGGRGYGPDDQGFDTVVDAKANTPPSATEGGKGEFALTAAAERFLEENREKPFLLYLAHNTPHIPLGAAPDKVAENAKAFHPVYAAMMETMDDAIGRVLAKVDALGLRERTWVVFASDNGGLHVLEFPGTPATRNAPFRAGKGHLHEGGLRVPLLVRGPGVKPAVESAPVVLTDLMPTFLELAGINAAQAIGPLDGVSLVKGLTGGGYPARTLFWHFPHYTNQGGRPGGAVRDGDWKLVVSYEDDAAELYNLADDIGETRNLAAAEPARTADLKKRLVEWRRSVGAQENTPNPAFDPALHKALYVDRDCSTLVAGATAAETEPAWKEWRAAMNAAVRGASPRVTPAQGCIELHARDSQPHGEKIRYEPQPQKNTVGFWVNASDWVEWSFTVDKPGDYVVDLLQGCGKGSGGSEVVVETAGQKLPVTVQETGHFQHFILREIGRVTLPAGAQSLSIRPVKKVGGAVMDVRMVRLRPAP